MPPPPPYPDAAYVRDLERLVGRLVVLLACVAIALGCLALRDLTRR